MKVEKDLDVFIESIASAENRVKRGDMGRETQELIRNLQEMKPKIADLSVKLNAAGEYETADKAIGAGKRLNYFFEEIMRNDSGSSNQNKNTPFTDSANIFDDFNKAGNKSQQSSGFDGFNSFEAKTPQQPSKSSGGDFWSQNSQGVTQTPPQPTQSSRSFFEEIGGDNNSKPQNYGGNTFFDHNSNKQALKTFQQKPTEVDDGLDLLGLDQPTAGANKPPQQTSTNHNHGINTFDLLGGQQHSTNPFGGPSPQQQSFGGQQSMGNLNMQQQQMMMMQMNSMGINPTLQQQMMMNPLMYQQMMMMMNKGNPNGMGGQANFQALPNQNASFGGSNKVSFSEPPRFQTQPQRQQNDPFGDLSSDLI